MAFRPTIGLEVHAELATASKMFCGCMNNPHETCPNANVCPVCMAHPGTLPVPNRQAIENVLRVGTALGSTLADYSEFDRKSYFYPDIPKGYQITQYEYPFVQGGALAGVDITRVHLEEDTARSIHEDGGTGTGGTSQVDFNRAGVPLMELVTEPVIHDAETAGRFARELQLLLRTLGVSNAELAKGEMRIEANISVSETDTFGTKVEVKNLNSFRSVERAIAYEIERQSTLISEGGKVVQETRGWDENNQKTFSQRIKEGSADYRYFPEPDIPKIKRSEIAAWSNEALAASLPELPSVRRARYQALGMTPEQAEYLTEGAVGAGVRARFFEDVLGELENNDALRTLAANYFFSDLAGYYAKNSHEEEFSNITPVHFAALIRMVGDNKLSSRGAKEVLLVLAQTGGEPEAIAKDNGLLQVSDPQALQAIVQEVLGANIAAVDEYRGGKESALQFLVGQSMKASKGAGNPGVLRELLLAELGK